LKGSVFAILNNQTELGDEFVTIMITGIFEFGDRCELVKKSIGVDIITATGSTNDGVEGKHRTRGNRGWKWCCGFEIGEWQKISAPTTAHDRKTLTLRVKVALTHSLPLSDAPHPFPMILNVVETRH